MRNREVASLNPCTYYVSVHVTSWGVLSMKRNGLIYLFHRVKPKWIPNVP